MPLHDLLDPMPQLVTGGYQTQVENDAKTSGTFEDLFKGIDVNISEHALVNYICIVITCIYFPLFLIQPGAVMIRSKTT